MYPQGQVRMTWVASPPPGAYQRGHDRAKPERYTGPPAYPAPPRWGFPSLAWRWPTSVAGTLPESVPAVERVRYLARHAIGMLWTLAVVAVLAAAAEVWRYVLLVQSRYGALSSSTVGVSDALVHTFAVLTLGVALITAVLVLWWLYVARAAAVEMSGYLPARSDRQFFVGMLIPGINLVVAGSVLAELEHAAQCGDRDRRPRPSRLVLRWWITWAVSGVLATVTVLWRLRDGVQAQADGVVLAACNDLVVAVAAVLTVLVVRRLVRLLVPIDAGRLRLMRIVQVRDAPEPPLRTVRAWDSPR